MYLLHFIYEATIPYCFIPYTYIKYINKFLLNICLCRYHHMQRPLYWHQTLHNTPMLCPWHLLSKSYRSAPVSPLYYCWHLGLEILLPRHIYTPCLLGPNIEEIVPIYKHVWILCWYSYLYISRFYKATFRHNIRVTWGKNIQQ